MAKKERIAGWSFFGLKKKQVLQYIDDLKHGMEKENKRSKKYIDALIKRVLELEENIKENEKRNAELENKLEFLSAAEEDAVLSPKESTPPPTPVIDLPQAPEELITADAVPEEPATVDGAHEEPATVYDVPGEPTAVSDVIDIPPDEDENPSFVSEPIEHAEHEPPAPASLNFDEIDLNDAGELVLQRLQAAFEPHYIENETQEEEPENENEDASPAAVPTFPKNQDGQEGDGPDWRHMLHNAYESEPSAHDNKPPELGLEQSEELREINRSLGIE